MLSHFDLSYLLTFPIKDDQARKQFLIGALVFLASFVVPILPTLVVTGYTMRIMRQVLKGERPHMVAWDEWTEMLIDGARLFGVRLIIMLPIFLLLCPLMGLSFAFPFIIENAGRNADWIILLYPLLLGGFSLLLIPLSIVSGVILPAAEVHVTDKVEFGAAFRVREWWPIFRANWSGFLLVLVIGYAMNFALGIIMQFAMITIVLICVLPFVLPGIGLYVSLVMYSAFAQAYITGKEQLQSAEVAATQ